jgi:hypothetical protein
MANCTDRPEVRPLSRRLTQLAMQISSCVVVAARGRAQAPSPPRPSPLTHPSALAPSVFSDYSTGVRYVCFDALLCGHRRLTPGPSA